MTTKTTTTSRTATTSRTTTARTRTRTRTDMVTRNTTIFNGVLQVIRSSKNGEWVGTMTQLRSQVSKLVGKDVVPGSPSAMRVVVNRILSRIRKAGVSVKFGLANNESRTRYVKFTVR